MTIHYTTSHLEDWITDMYKQININHPDQIDIDLIAEFFNVTVFYKQMNSSFCVIGDISMVTVNEFKSYKEQKEDFFHELCHVLRHEGHQGKMPKMFMDLQEWDADRFATVAQVPPHMFEHINFESLTLIQDVTETFNVTVDTATERLNYIERRLIFEREQKQDSAFS